ncbi:helix-turn-helix domain-containing protein [Streptomyces sp. NPDC001255]|uniref:helix-turn-helix domain-containing protein n=1 Tax=Streptomyces sp. NPDC001255 TaxID=3364550 RepID=UPI0036ACBC09
MSLSCAPPPGEPPHLLVGPISPHAEARQQHQDEFSPEISPHQDSTALTSPAPFTAHPWYSTSELATRLRVDASTLRRWRTATPPQGPPFFTVSGRVILYSALDVETWLRKRRTVPVKGIRGR